MDAAVAAAGAAVGAGAVIALAGALPTTPDLKAVLARLDPGPSAAALAPATRHDALAARLADALGLQRYAADLALVDETPGQLAVRKAAYALLGLAFPPVLALVMGVVGLRLPWAIPGAASLALAAVLFFAPDLDLRRTAAAVRAEMRRAVCVFLELVALERVADAGAAEALERAADIGDGRAFTLIRDALLRARLFGVPPWRELERLSDELRVAELGDVADIMRLSGEDGAAVYATLRARATSLSTALLNADAASANAASEHMVVPVAMLGLAFMALLGFPALSRIVFG
jgi:hypothetical protein